MNDLMGTLLVGFWIMVGMMIFFFWGGGGGGLWYLVDGYRLIYGGFENILVCVLILVFWLDVGFCVEKGESGCFVEMR